jgi:hypothetical protein
MEDFRQLSHEAGRSLHDYYYCMTFEGRSREQLPIAVITPKDEEEEKEEEDARREGNLSGNGEDNHEGGHEACDGRDVPAVESVFSREEDNGEGSRAVDGSPRRNTDARQSPAIGNSSREGAGMDVGTSVEQDDLSSQHSHVQLYPDYDDKGRAWDLSCQTQ